jgi:hypothetical protein
LLRGLPRRREKREMAGGRSGFATYLLMLFTLAFTLLFFSMNLTASDDVSSSGIAEEEYEEPLVEGAGTEPMLRRPPTPSPTPTTTPLVGPIPMKALLGDCFQFVGRDGNGDDNRYEVCGYKSVRQTVVKSGNAFACGYWNKWNTVVEGGTTKYVSMLYDDGESCNDKVRRQTTVVFRCNPAAKEPLMLSASEPSMCQYQLDVDSALWCDVEKAGLAGPAQRTLPKKL